MGIEAGMKTPRACARSRAGDGLPALSTTLDRATERLGRAGSLDGLAEPLSAKVAEVVGHGTLKDLLSGTWLGHPLHPLLTDLPIGAWTSAFILDLVGGKASQKAADTLVLVGVLSAVPTAASGLSDWSDYRDPERRIGLAHAGANVIAHFAGTSRRRRLGLASRRHRVRPGHVYYPDGDIPPGGSGSFGSSDPSSSQPNTGTDFSGAGVSSDSDSGADPGLVGARSDYPFTSYQVPTRERA